MNVVYATSTTSVFTSQGAQVLVREGSHWPADDPVVLAQPSLFSDDPRHGISYSQRPAALDEEAPVEQTTARPGEKRGAVRRG
jgi:hypothetical protein